MSAIKTIGSRFDLVINVDKLKEKSIAIIGVGGTGSTVANLLCRYEFKKVFLIDGDIIEDHNLDRQILYFKEDVGKKKAESAKDKLNKFYNNITSITEFVNNTNITTIGKTIKNVNLIIDCTDNFETREIINDFAKKQKIPWIYCGAIKQQGAIFFIKSNGPCFKCFNDKKQNRKCKEFGVLSPIVSLVSSWTASIALNYLAENKIEDSMIRINLEDNSVIKLKINKKKDCCK
jgi:adenylyltransferase/sulfurtransferase